MSRLCETYNILFVYLKTHFFECFAFINCDASQYYLSPLIFITKYKNN